MNYDSFTTIEPTFGIPLPFDLITPEVETNSTSQFEANNTNKDRIHSIFLEDLTLSIESPSNEDFSFLNSIELFISSTNHSEQKIATKTNIPDNIGSVIVCDLIDVDLQEFIKDDKIAIRVYTETDETINNQIEVKIASEFVVLASVFK